MKKIFCIIGRSASGKTSLAKTIAKELNLNIVKSYTTRPMCPGETEYNSDHYFVNEDEVWLYRNQIVTKTKINGYQYFTTLDMLLKSDIYVIDPNGYRTLSKNLSKLHVKVELIPIYVKVPKATLYERACRRGDSLSDYKMRYESEDMQFKEFEHSLVRTGTSVIHNIDFYRSVERLRKIILSQSSLKRKIQYWCKKLKRKGSR